MYVKNVFSKQQREQREGGRKEGKQEGKEGGKKLGKKIIQEKNINLNSIVSMREIKFAISFSGKEPAWVLS